MAGPRNIDPTRAIELHNAGVTHDSKGNLDAAADCYRQAIAANPEQLVSRRALASLSLDLGNHSEARELYTDLIRLEPFDVEAHYAYSKLTTYLREDVTIGALDALSRSIEKLSWEHQVKLCFTLGKANQDIGEYNAALEAFRLGNDLHYDRFPYDEDGNFAMLDDVRRSVDSAVVDRYRCSEESTECTPIFVLGMPRTGSTLVEQILASHSAVSAGGELRYLKAAIQNNLIGSKGTFSAALPEWTNASMQSAADEYTANLKRHANGNPFVVDKMPGNFAMIGLIIAMFPTAKIIHTARHPMATLWSNFSTLFGDALYYTYRLDVLQRFYGKYEEMMEHWNRSLPQGSVFNLEYEDLVTAPKKSSRH